MSKQCIAFFSSHVTNTINPVSGLLNRENQLDSISKWDSKKVWQIYKTITNIQDKDKYYKYVNDTNNANSHTFKKKEAISKNSYL